MMVRWGRIDCWCWCRVDLSNCWLNGFHQCWLGSVCDGSSVMVRWLSSVCDGSRVVIRWLSGVRDGSSMLVGWLSSVCDWRMWVGRGCMVGWSCSCTENQYLIFVLHSKRWKFTVIGDLVSWVADADIGLRNGWVWSVNRFRVVWNLLQVSVRSQHILLFAGDCWCNNRLTIIVSNASVAHGDDGEEAHKLGTTNKQYEAY